MSVKDRATLIQQINDNITDNANGEISGSDVRETLIDIVDSYTNGVTDNSVLGLKNYDPARVYLIDETTLFNSILYQCTENGASGTFDPAKWQIIGSDSKAFGINANQFVAPLPVSVNNGTTGITIAQQPPSNARIDAYINGLKYAVGDGTKNATFYFSADNGTTAKPFSNVVVGDTLFFNAVTIGFDLDATDRVSLNYEKIQ